MFRGPEIFNTPSAVFSSPTTLTRSVGFVSGIHNSSELLILKITRAILQDTGEIKMLGAMISANATTCSLKSNDLARN